MQIFIIQDIESKYMFTSENRAVFAARRSVRKKLWICAECSLVKGYQLSRRRETDQLDHSWLAGEAGAGETGGAGGGAGEAGGREEMEE